MRPVTNRQEPCRAAHHPYRLGQRRVAAEQTRARIIAAARALLTSSGGLVGFTVDAVAKQAGVSRMTVYYQFDSKAGLLDALFDDLAERRRDRAATGRLEPLPGTRSTR